MRAEGAERFCTSWNLRESQDFCHLTWLLQTLGLGVATSSFNIGEDPLDSLLKARGWWWSIHSGERREGGERVTAFRANLAKLGDRGNLAKHAFKKTRTLRHPHILAIIDGQETDMALEVICEAVTPLPDWLRAQREKASPKQLAAVLTWGLRCVLEALNFLHTQNLCHGLCCAESIFVTESGDFKLWGLDVIASLDGEDSGHFRARESELAALSGGAHYRSPERSSGEWDKVAKHYAASDVFSLGQAIPGMFFDDFPLELSKVCKKMVAPQCLARAKISRILAIEWFKSNPYNMAMLFIEELSLKNHGEMVAFFRSLSTTMRSMPTATRIHKVVPALKSGIQRSIGPDCRAEDCREIVSAALPALSEIGATMTGEEYRRFVVPSVMPLFAVKDRAVRMQLLERIDALVKHMVCCISNR